MPTLLQIQVLEIFAEVAYFARIAMGHNRKTWRGNEFDRVFRPLSPGERRVWLRARPVRLPRQLSFWPLMARTVGKA